MALANRLHSISTFGSLWVLWFPGYSAWHDLPLVLASASHVGGRVWRWTDEYGMCTSTAWSVVIDDRHPRVGGSRRWCESVWRQLYDYVDSIAVGDRCSMKPAQTEVVAGGLGHGLGGGRNMRARVVWRIAGGCAREGGDWPEGVNYACDTSEPTGCFRLATETITNGCTHTMESTVASVQHAGRDRGGCMVTEQPAAGRCRGCRTHCTCDGDASVPMHATSVRGPQIVRGPSVRGHGLCEGPRRRRTPDD